ncbi:hypothetical protein [Nocardia sp. NPDC050710]|uniref:hypothetical protein n=1 Tax=Nocardia sp. NPDC050710 TaxID=3157220 RepID=UPI0033DD0103
MGKLVIVEKDPVRGTDTHTVSGTDSSAPPVPYAGTGDFEYNGAITDRLSDFVSIDGTPVALLTSASTLNAGEDQPPAGKHSGPQGGNFTPPTPAPNKATLQITDKPLGAGSPSAGAGSSVLSVDGTRVLLDGDHIDTCSGVGATAGSSVTAAGQSFVTAS